ncbi:CorA metal ion transporter, partial [Podochytrium sp. JEL0797]
MCGLAMNPSGSRSSSSSSHASLQTPTKPGSDDATPFNPDVSAAASFSRDLSFTHKDKEASPSPAAAAAQLRARASRLLRTSLGNVQHSPPRNNAATLPLNQERPAASTSKDSSSSLLSASYRAASLAAAASNPLLRQDTDTDDLSSIENDTHILTDSLLLEINPVHDADADHDANNPFSDRNGDDEDHSSDFPAFRNSHELDYSAISDHLTEAQTRNSELYKTYTQSQKPSPHSPPTFLQQHRREPRHHHAEFFYQQQTERFMFHSDLTSTIRSPFFETLPFAIFPPNSINDILRSGPFWLDVCNPTNDELSTLARVFKIHPLTTEDILTEETREKCETFPGYDFVTIRSFDSDQYSLKYMQPINVYIVVFRECVLTFHFQPIIHLNNVLRRIEQLRVYGSSITSDWINYALIDDVTDGIMPSLRHIELEVDAIDELVLILKEREQSDMLRRIGHARKRVMMLLRLLITKADVIKAVIKRCAQRLAPESETTLYLGDIQDHIITMVQNLNHCEKTLTRSHSNYLAQISIEITQASNRTNDVVMRMTALASILVPLNIITGLWGMNVKVPGEEGESLVWFFGI